MLHIKVALVFIQQVALLKPLRKSFQNIRPQKELFNYPLTRRFLKALSKKIVKFRMQQEAKE
jgi:hypothetical protein